MTTIAEKIPYNVATQIAEKNVELKLVHSRVSSHFDEELIEFLSKYVSLSDRTTKIIRSYEIDKLNSIHKQRVQSIINLNRINDVRYIQQYFRLINTKLQNGNLFIGCVETNKQKRETLLEKYPKVIYYPYYLFTFIIKRFVPKFWLTKKVYFALTKGRGRYLSIAETLGRLVACGFEVINYEEINAKTYFVVKKVIDPPKLETASFGALIKLRRFGKNGKYINVYKFRTMHPYSEFLQDFIYKRNGSTTGDKFDYDFRVASWGKFMRKFWIDELPMLLNLVKGDIKLVGVRPLSAQKFYLYSNELQELRKKHKPGLIPPFYADLPQNFNELMESEKRYLLTYERNPILTDIKYFFKVFTNIFFNNARSN